MIGVLVTGGTGTFGHAFVPEMLDIGRVDRVVVLSRDELKQAEMERSLKGHPDFHKLRFYLGDVRDRLRLESAMHNITHIVHAAALKRIEQCERDPIEAVKTNVVGTANVIDAALRAARASIASPAHMIGLSTDKSCNPINLYGATKLTMERLVIAANNLAGGRMRFSVVRYGNIFGSRGSVARIGEDPKAARLPITVTDLDATRFFMRIEEAVEMVRRDMFTYNSPDPSTRVNITYATQMPAFSLRDLLIAMDLRPDGKLLPGDHITGIGSFEKLHEEIVPGMSSADARRMSIDELREEVRQLENEHGA